MILKTFRGISRVVITDRVLLGMPDHMRDALPWVSELQRWIWLCKNPILQWANAAEIEAPVRDQLKWWWLWIVLMPLCSVLEFIDRQYKGVRNGIIYQSLHQLFKAE